MFSLPIFEAARLPPLLAIAIIIFIEPEDTSLLDLCASHSKSLPQSTARAHVWMERKVLQRPREGGGSCGFSPFLQISIALLGIPNAI